MTTIDEARALVAKHPLEWRAMEDGWRMRELMVGVLETVAQASAWHRKAQENDSLRSNVERLRTALPKAFRDGQQSNKWRASVWRRYYREGVDQLIAASVPDHCDERPANWKMRRLDVLITRLVQQRDKALELADLNDQRAKEWERLAQKRSAEMAEMLDRRATDTQRLTDVANRLLEQQRGSR